MVSYRETNLESWATMKSNFKDVINYLIIKLYSCQEISVMSVFFKGIYRELVSGAQKLLHAPPVADSMSRRSF